MMGAHTKCNLRKGTLNQNWNNMSIHITIEIPGFYKQTRAHGNTTNDQWALSFLYRTTYHEFDNTTFL
jgi:hypothetical protein